MRKLISLLTPREKRQGILVLGMLMLQALLDMAGVVSIMPFLAVLANPDMVHANAVLASLYQRLGFTSDDRFLFALGIGAFVIITVGAMFHVATTYAINRFTQMREYALAARLLEAYLRQPYTFFLNRNTAELSKSILSEVHMIVAKVMQPALLVVAAGLTLVVLAGLLVALDPFVALVASLLLLSAYAVVYMSVHGLLHRIGKDRVRANGERYTAASEALGGIKDLKVLGREEGYLARFRGPAARFARHNAMAATLAAAPKYLIEAVAFGGVLALALTLMSVREDLGVVLPLLGLYVFAGYRLLPAAQNIYAGISSIRFGLPAVANIHRDLIPLQAGVARTVEDPAPRLSLDESIRFEGVRYQYPGADRLALDAEHLTIRARTAIGFVGPTGAGKTTAIDLILGLIEPTEGQILIDGVPLAARNIREWQRAIGYVPQVIYLVDATVAQNIAFGVDYRKVDHGAVERAARLASVHEFIVQELSHGYDTMVGERGVRLSGGQRQRIGIARALYHDPSLLVLDEATNALDTPTERSVMEAVQRLRGEKTIIMVAHRISTVRHCQQIIVLEDGRISGVGTFEELNASNASFQQLAVA